MRKMLLLLLCGFVCLISISSTMAQEIFAPQTRYPAGNNPRSVAIGDFDNDGRQDLAVANHQSDDVSVLLNQLPMRIDVNIMPNSINPRSHGVVPVALLGSEDFDVADVDVTTLRFGPDEATTAHDLTYAITYTDHLQDVNLDGFTYLMTHFRTQETGIVCGDESATLTGNMLSGQPIEGTDSIRTVGCGRRGNTQSIFERQQQSPSRNPDHTVDVSFKKKN